MGRSEDLSAMLENIFKSKQYCFDVRGIKLPSPNLMFIQKKGHNSNFPELKRIERDLNEVKSKLNEYESTQWHKHAESMNPAGKVMSHLERVVKVEFLTQAWCEFYELINKYKLIPKEALSENEFLSFHLCEAPGAFVASLNHYLKLNHPNLNWFWKANSLNPCHEGNDQSKMINDDRFMLPTINRWDFGPDMTGDITHRDYPRYLRSLIGTDLPHLVTADGSFDCQDKPEEEKNSVTWLQLKETLNALNILRKNGNFIIKISSFFDRDTVCLLNLLAASFEKVTVEKPATSSEGNSEVYVVCQQFKGRVAIQPYLDRLIQTDFQTFKKFSMFERITCKRSNNTFYRQIVECAEHFSSIQRNVINCNIGAYNDNANDPNLRKHCHFLQEKVARQYIKRYKLKRISSQDNVVQLPKLKYQIERKPLQVMESRDHTQGSHNERLQIWNLQVEDLLVRIIEELRDDDLCSSLLYRRALPERCEVPVEAFDINYGKPTDVVRSSQFCHGRFMRMRNEIMQVYGPRAYNIAIEDFADHHDKEDIRKDYDCSSSFFETDVDYSQRATFRSICGKLSNLREGDRFKLIGFLPLLTQFNVNVFCVLTQIFKEVIYEAPNTLNLSKFQKEKFNMWKKVLQQLENNYTPKIAVVSFLPVSYITGSDNTFYEWLFDANNSCLFHQINQAIHNLTQA